MERHDHGHENDLRNNTKAIARYVRRYGTTHEIFKKRPRRVDQMESAFTGMRNGMIYPWNGAEASGGSGYTKTLEE